MLEKVNGLMTTNLGVDLNKLGVCRMLTSMPLT